VDVLFDAAGLTEGDHHARLLIHSNDRMAGEQSIDVLMRVTDVSAVGDNAPRVITFRGAVPNPFNPMTELRFSLPEAAHVSLEVFDLRGRLVRSLSDGRMAGGPQVVVWNGRDHLGQGVSSGKYFARLKVGGDILVKPMTLVR
jgi:hypothetical protein